MNREEIIRMAREAGMNDYQQAVVFDSLERFAALVAAAEREECSEWLRENFGEHCIATAMIAREVWDEENLLEKSVPPPDTLEYEIYRHQNKTRQD